MPESVIVKSVSEGKPWNDLTFFDVVFERNGEDFSASWGRKGEGNPQLGEEVEGEFFKDKKDQWRFRKASKPTGSSSGVGSGGKREWQPESQRDPERSARILRQHSQSAALAYASEVGAFKSLSEATLKDDPRAVVPDFFWELVDQFDADVIQAAKQGADKSEGAGPLPSPSPASRAAQGSEVGVPSGTSGIVSDPEQKDRDEHQQWFESHLVSAGANIYAASKLATFILERLKPEQGQKAETGLKDFETQRETLANLEQAYRLTEGEVLPSGPDMEDDIPF